MFKTFIVTATLVLLPAGPVVAAGADNDGDGVWNHLDNCPDVSNTPQVDDDDPPDGLGDICDCDFDGDLDCDSADDWTLWACTTYWEGNEEACARVDMNNDGAMNGWDQYFYNEAKNAFAAAVAAPLPGLPVVTVVDAEPNGLYNQADIDAALAACGLGCNLRFLDVTYDDVAMNIGAFPNGFAMYGGGPGETVLRAPLFESTQADWDHTILVTNDAPDGIVIRRLVLDGRKSEQEPPLDASGTALDWPNKVNKHGALVIGEPGGGNVSSGTVTDVEIRNYIYLGMNFTNSPGWVVTDNYVHGIGCNQDWEPCGALLPPPNPWDSLPDDAGVLQRKLRGYGINLNAGTDGSEITSNVVEGAVKIGIQFFLGTNPSNRCDQPTATQGLLFQENLVANSATGFTNVRGCGVSYVDNVAEDLADTEKNTQSPFGFTCSQGGLNSQWVGNIARRIQGLGFSIQCSDGGILFQDNISEDNCQGTLKTVSDITFFGKPYSGDPLPSGVTIENAQSTSPLCADGMRVEKYDDLDVNGGAIQSGARYGLWIRDATRVDVRDALIQPAQSGTGTGVFMDYRANPLQQVLVHGSTTISSSYLTPWEFTPPHGPNDGDDSAICSEEDPEAGIGCE